MSNWGKCVGQPLALGGARPQESLLFVGKPVLPPRIAQWWLQGIWWESRGRRGLKDV